MSGSIFLVAEDKELISTVTRITAGQGYECIVATSAAAATQRRTGGGIELVIMQPLRERDGGKSVIEILRIRYGLKPTNVILLGSSIPRESYTVEQLPLDEAHFVQSIFSHRLQAVRPLKSKSRAVEAPAPKHPPAAKPPPLPIAHSAASSGTKVKPPPVQAPSNSGARRGNTPAMPQAPPLGRSGVAAVGERKPTGGGKSAEAKAQADVGPSASKTPPEVVIFEESMIPLPVPNSSRGRPGPTIGELTPKRDPQETPRERPLPLKSSPSNLRAAAVSASNAPDTQEFAKILATASSEIELLSKESARLREALDVARDEKRLLSAARDTQNATILFNDKLRIDASTEIVALQHEVAALRHALEKSRESQIAAEVELAQLASERTDALTSARQEDLDALQARQAEVAHLQERLDVSETARAAVARELEMARSAIEAGARTSGEELTQLTEALRVAMDTQSALQVELARTKSELLNIRGTAHGASFEVERLHTELAAASGDYAGALAELKNLRAALAEALKGRGARDVEMERLQRSLEVLRADAADHEREVVEFRARLSAHQVTSMRREVEIDTLKERVVELSRRDSDAQRQAGKLEEAERSAIARAEELEGQVASLTTRLKEALARQSAPLVLEGTEIAEIRRHGTLDTEGLAMLATRLADAKANVELELHSHNAIRRLWLRRGALLGATSDSESESLIGRAQRDGLIGAKQAQELTVLRTATVSEQCDALLARGFIREAESAPLLKRYVEQIALEGFAEEASDYRIAEEDPPPGSLLLDAPSPLMPLLLAALRRTLQGKPLLALLGGPRAVAQPQELRENLETLGFSEGERGVFARLGPGATVEALTEASTLRPDALQRCLLIGKYLGLLRMEPPSEGARSASYEPGFEERRLKAKYAQVQDADYFTILGIPRSAGVDEVRRAYSGLCEEFNPLRFAGHPNSQTRIQATTVYTVVEEAARALEDDWRRGEYARHLAD